jgi:transposase
MTQFDIFVGIDVAKATLDVAVHPGGDHFSCPNSAKGLRSLVASLERLAGQGSLAIGFEASGGYERHLAGALHAAGLTAFRLDASQTRNYARAERQMAKTDRLDAAMIARAVKALHGGMEPCRPDPDAAKLAEYLRLREALVDQKTLLKANLESLDDAFVRRTINGQIARLEATVVLVEKRMRDLVAADQVLRERHRLLVSAPGVGPIVAATLMARLAELGSLSSRAVAAIAGVAPYDRQSGTATRSKRCAGGRPLVRKALYLAVLSIIREKSDSHLKAFYTRLREAGKPAKIAMVAVMRKLLVALNTMVAKNTEWHHA